MELLERFMAKVKKNGNDGCWIWTGSRRNGRKNTGYGCISINNRQKYVHRVAYELFVGIIPSGMLVCHHCDNIICVNPNHLFLGTQSDNIRDCIHKNRFDYHVGEKHGMAKLTWDKVRKIRVIHQRGEMSYSKLGKEYDVSVSCIEMIVNNTNWKETGL